MKKLLSLFLSLAIILVSLPTNIFTFTSKAESDPIDIWGGLSSATGGGSFTKGDGSADNPYVIENGDQLYLMVYNFGTIDKKLNGTAAHYKLGCDIYLNDISNYDSWGKSGFDMSTLNNWSKYEDSFCHRTFYGNFNGDGHTIYGLYANSYRIAAFLPNVGSGAVIRNVNFKNSYMVNTSGVNANDLEDSGDSAGQKVWYAGAYGSAGVLLSRADAAGDGDFNTVDFTINNCAITEAYVEAKYFTSAFVAAANSCQPYIANCMTANITLNSTSTTQGVKGAIINTTYGSTNPTCNMENIIAVGYQIYGAGRDEMWSGYKVPAISHTYTFKNVYSTVSNKYTHNHSSFGNVSFTDTEVTVVDASKLIGALAETTIPTFDWSYTWRSVEGDYPKPMREYVVPTGDEYYQNGGPKYTTDTWDGSVAGHFAAGDGSLQDPYLIASCEEFYRMATMPESGMYYKIANGVTDLYFNDISGKSYSTLMNYFSWGIGTKYSTENITFEGNFDGNGVTMHGILATGTTNAALFSKLGNATLKNFTIRYSYFKTSSSSATGTAAIAAEIKDGSTVNMRNIAVIDSNVDGKTSAAGFVSNANSNTKIYIDNSIVSSGKIASKGQPAYQAAFVADGTKTELVVRNSISLGISPLSNSAVSYNGTYINVYTDTAPTTETVGVNKVQSSALQGETAKSTCPEFNWNYSWNTTATIPMPQNQQNDNGVVGEEWTGEVAMSFADGNGTKSKPYLINTAEMLARMLLYGNVGEYYKLTADIYINDINKENWQNTAKEWYTSKNVSAFEGCLDGNGFTVHGLYANADEPNEYAALLPVIGTSAQITKLKVDNAYLTGINGSFVSAIAGVLEDNSAVMASISACLVNNNVVLSGSANAGGIIASVGFSRLKIENCLFRGNIQSSENSYGICNNVIGELLVYETISLNYTPFDVNSNTIARNVYTNAQTSKNGVIVLSLDQMIGIAARNYMTALDYSALWRLNTNNTPEPINNNKVYNGVKGEVWSGRIASSFAGGKGTASNPYIIETGEQLALLISNSNNYIDKYFKLACDIYLNDVSDELWNAKVGCNTWFNAADFYHAFTSHLDGDGHVVFGMYYNYKTTPQNSYLALIPRIGGSATVKNIGVSEAYIKASTTDGSVYAGGIFGMGSAFYDFYNQKINFNDTVGDEFLVPGDAKPTKLPLISNCFVDHTCYIEATSVGGIGNPGGAAVAVRDCIVTADLHGDETSESREGGIIGSFWTTASRVYNCVSFTQSNSGGIAGSQVWVRDIGGSVIYLEDVYYYGDKNVFGTTRVKRPQWRLGEEAKAAMPNLDWENTWRTEDGGTPVLRVFDKEGRDAATFSDKSFVVPDVKISFETNANDVVVEDLIGKPYESLFLPIPQRQGYKFVAWHGFDDLTCEYKYDYFLPRDITLYAEWQEVTVTQNFEEYPYTMWDCDSSVWRYNTPDNAVEYDSAGVHDGNRSMQLMFGGNDVQTLLVNYKKTLTPGQVYSISFWVSSSSQTKPQFALAHKMHPDYMAADRATEFINEVHESQDKWKRYEYTFTAQTPWVAIKVLTDMSIYIDDIVISLSGDLIEEVQVKDDVFEGAFYSSTIERALLLSGVNNVGEFSFAYNNFIKDIYISNTVFEINKYAFYDCDKLSDVWYAGNEDDFKNIVICDENEALLNATWHFNSCGVGEQHTYDNACDSVCNNCEYKRVVPDHIYDDDQDVDCNVCGEERNKTITGDINNDGKVNNRDLGILMQYLNGWDVTINKVSADVNGDNAVNNRDYGLLMQYTNGWDVEFK